MSKPRVTKNPGETITQRPTRVTCRYTLRNGQVLSVYFDRRRNHDHSTDVIYVWKVGIFIGDRKSKANRWYNRRGRPVRGQTGECGLEGLAVAARYIRAFANHFIHWRSELQIGWADDKRMRVYRWLLRYPGFTWYADELGEGQCIAYRDPELYQWTPKSDVSVDEVHHAEVG